MILSENWRWQLAVRADWRHMQSPEFVRLIGKGKFLLGNASVESSFELYKNPYWIGIVANEKNLCDMAIRLFYASVTVQLSGTLNDGRIVKASSLYITKLSPIGSPPRVEFTAHEGVSIGHEKDTPPDESRYPLIGYFDGRFSLVHNGWDINTIPCPSPKTAQALAEKWRCPVEGMELQLKRKDSTIDQHRDFARVVMSLLSLASGTGVSYHRHFFTWANEELEIWRHMTGDEMGPCRPIVPKMGRFLEQTLPSWEAMSQEQRKVLRLALDYINLSGLGYLDTRLFHIVQPWEFIAKAWGMQGELPESVICLRSRLQQAREQWSEDYPNSDPQGFWGSRISSIFDWPKLRDAIERLSASFGLDLERVGLDLNDLKKARDSVAHSGKLPDQLPAVDRPTIDLLIAGQYCLQLLLLRMLAYKGPVYHATGGNLTIVDIDKALTTVREWRQNS